ncbi:hypothetical protein A0J48_021910 [Sphaerospermopsis aphanizomenoides BCCUSP55]|uniref:hypothetical protein n=1 Tax=Sphaerospermopsis aphanizomenoides TaxID=459663 RepID=UPI001905BB5B|nr:hypothetical protein [Sphaerospermopsis aphanizomenoides]MBK1990148.1 hypothetical protein [Sphaerospermopsis aphanizomenoides BCCUSP55]
MSIWSNNLEEVLKEKWENTKAGAKKATEIAAIAVPLVANFNEAKTIPQVPNEPSYSQVQTTETKCDPLAKQSQDLNQKNPTEIPKSTGELVDAKEKSDDQKRDQIDKDITAENQPTISDPPNADNFSETGVSPDRQIIPRPDSQLSTEVVSLPDNQQNRNAELANQLGKETYSPSSQPEQQDAAGETGNI